MSDFGISEANRWDADFRQRFFPALPAAYVTDDLGDYVMPNGTLASCRFIGLIGDAGAPTVDGNGQPLAVGRPWYRIRSDCVPGQSLWYHERGHDLYRRITDRVGGSLATSVIWDAFQTRGCVWQPPIDWLSTEQWASFIPECFLGEWGGYQHPLWGFINFNDSRVVAYFNSSASQPMRDFFLGYATRGFDMTRIWTSADIALTTNNSGNVSAGGRTVSGLWTANPALQIPAGIFDPNGAPLIAVCSRIGISGSESSLPNTAAAAAFDASGAFANVHVRGDFVRSGTIYVRATVFQSA
jgi:hypothetical protein